MLVEVADGPGKKVKELLQKFGVGPTSAARPSVGAASSRDLKRKRGDLKRKRGEDSQAAGGPSIKAEHTSVPVRINLATNEDLCLGCTDLEILLQSRPVRDPEVTYGMLHWMACVGMSF